MSGLRKHDYTLDGDEWDLSLQSLTEAPVDELQKNPRARKIDLSQNFMVKLPDSFTRLTHLVELDLSKNRLQRLPEDFGNLHRLNKLDLYGNKLKTLPLTFGQLTKLRWLDLKDNPLEPHLAKTAGDCTNPSQCRNCAFNCVKFMKSERSRVEAETTDRELKLKERLEYDRRQQEKNQKEKDKKKAKNVRRSARKAQQKIDQNNDDEEIDSEEEADSESDQKEKESKRSFFGSVLSLIFTLIRFLIIISMISFFIFSIVSIGLHLQSGHKLETFDDIITAISDSLKRVHNYEQFSKDVVLLIENIVKSLKNWKKNLNSIKNETQN